MPHRWKLLLALATISVATFASKLPVAAENPPEVVEERLESLGATIGNLLLVLCCFVALAIVCDDYLAPSLEALVDTFKIPHDVAAATFLAFGSSAPEISINCVATAHGKVSLSLGTVLGSGIIAFTAIPACCVLVSHGQVLRLEAIPLLRDTFFYAISLLAFIQFSADGKFSTGKNLFFLGLFGIYLVSLVLLGKLYHSNEPKGGERFQEERTKLFEEDREKDAIEEFKCEKTKFMSRYKSIDTISADKSRFEEEHELETEGQKELEATGDFVSQTCTLLSLPLKFLFKFTIPPFCVDVNGEEDLDKVIPFWPFTMTVSLVYVAVFSELVLNFTAAFAEDVGLPHNIAGLTILALGAQIPDLFASVAVAKKGEGPSSIANAIGSQIFNILVGVGVPFLVFNLQQHKPIVTATEHEGSALALTGVLMLMLTAVFLVLCFRHVGLSSKRPSLTSLDAIILGMLYVATLGILVSSQVIVA